MDQCGTLINTSNNLETVMRNVPIYEKSLHYLTQCSDSNLKMCRLKSQQQLKDMYAAWFAKKEGVLNSAVVRCSKATIAHAKTLKTEKGQAKHILAFANKSLAMPDLPPDSRQLLEGIRADMESALSANN
jgi:hypothetical protein